MRIEADQQRNTESSGADQQCNTASSGAELEFRPGFDGEHKIKFSIEDFHTYRRRLPHWRLSGSIYWITWRVKQGSSDLAPEERQIVCDSLFHFDGERYKLHAFVVMNDHVHVIAEPLGIWSLEKLIQRWKNFTARKINELRGSSGSVWQDEYFDRIIRDDAEYWEKLQYIANNPGKRWPALADYEWVYLAFMSRNLES